MANYSSKKPLTRGERILLVAPLFVLLIVFGVLRFRHRTKPVEPYLVFTAPPKMWFSNAALSPDGKYIVAVGGDRSKIAPGNGVLQVYNAHSGVLLFTRVVGDYAGITALAISPDSSKVACSQDTTKIWRLSNGSLLHDLGHYQSKKYPYVGSIAGSLAFSLDNRVLVSGSGGSVSGGMARLWNAQTGAFLRFIDKSNGIFKPNRENFSHSFPSFSPDGKWLACIASGGMYGATDNGINFRPTRNTNNRVQLWNIVTGQLVRVFPQKNIVTFSFSPDGKTLATSSFQANPIQPIETPEVHLYDLQTGALIWLTQNEIDGKGNISRIPDDGIAFAPDGQTLACQDWLGRIRFYNARSGRQLQIVLTTPLTNDYSAGGSPTIAFSQDGKTLLSRRNTTIYLWHTADWQSKL